LDMVCLSERRRILRGQSGSCPLAFRQGLPSLSFGDAAQEEFRREERTLHGSIREWIQQANPAAVEIADVAGNKG